MSHPCFAKVNRELVKYNTRLVQNLIDSDQLMVATERIRRLRDGKKAKIVIASFCPFCGAKIETFAINVQHETIKQGGT